MASARDNDIVIECSPYSDSETEIKNLKSMSYELIPTIYDIFTTGDSVSSFVSTFLLAGGLLVLFPLILYIAKYAKPSSDGWRWMITPSLNVLYSVLFIIGFIISNSENDEKMLTPVYIAFSVSIFLVFAINIIKMYTQDNTTIDGYANLIFPGLEKNNYGWNFFYFVVGIGLIFLFISLLRLANQQAFSPIVLLGSYCFLQVLNYLSSILQSTNNQKQIMEQTPPQN